MYTVLILLYHTFENTRVFYPTQYINFPIDTPWVQCIVRDVKGGADAQTIRLIVKENLGGE